MLGSALVVPSGAAAVPASASGAGLSVSDVETIIARAVGRARQLGVSAMIAVTDREGNVLGVFAMDGARTTTMITATKPADPDGLEGTIVPAAQAAVSKAGTAAYLSSNGNAYSTRTAGFIIQEHFPPGVANSEGGPLFGVQFSQLPCSDVVANPLPLGLSGDPGGLPIYKNGLAAGGVGIEGEGIYGVNLAHSVEEDIAVAATQGFAAPTAIRADQVGFGTIRLPYLNEASASVEPADLSGTVLSPIRAAPPSRYQSTTLGGIAAKFDPRFFPPRASAGLSADDVTRILTQAVQQAAATPSGIRLIGSDNSNYAVVSNDGTLLGAASSSDAPEFGFDVSAQKARTAAFFSSPTADAQLHRASPGYAAALAVDGVPLNGSIAFSSRAVGALARPFFPDGQDSTPNGPASKPINVWSPFNTGLQSALARPAMFGPASSCTPIPALRNGMQIHAGAVPLYRGTTLVGAIGISGDGILQDDLVSAAASAGFAAPASMTADHVVVRGTRLPFVEYPRNPSP